jgi:hypothetical protein
MKWRRPGGIGAKHYYQECRNAGPDQTTAPISHDEANIIE